ncbi:MAG: hypothetical protein IJJ80_10895 [Clostridia bacterium]|nr:hypothetical protein [Clostridia bacterium]MBQ6233998.1 hypothetical protein [Clostridia bacterium]
MQAEATFRQERLKKHLTYDVWKYLLVIVACWMGWELLYTATAYRSPQEKRIDVMIMSATASDELFESFLKPIWEEATPDMELVEGVTLLPGGVDDYYSNINLTVKLAAGEGDIYLLPQDTFKQLALNGAFVGLDQYIADGLINIDGLEVDKARLTLVDEDTGKATTQLFGIPTDLLYGYMDGLQFDNRNAVMAIAVNNGNEDNVVTFFNALLQAGRGEMPEWLRDAEAKPDA